MAEKKRENRFANKSLAGTGIANDINAVASRAVVKDIDIDLIDFDEKNEYLNGYDEDDLETLGNALDTTEQQAIIGVYKLDNGRYLCYSGHRRIITAKTKGKKTITSQISKLPEDPDKRTETLILMNVQRDNSRPLYIARQANELENILRRRGFKGNINKEIGKKLGFSEGQIIRYKKITKLPEEFQELCKLKNFPFTTFDKSFYDMDTEQKQEVLKKINVILNENDNITQTELALIIKEVLNPDQEQTSAQKLQIQKEEQTENQTTIEDKKPRVKGRIYKNLDTMFSNIENTVSLNYDVEKIKDKEAVKESAEKVIKMMQAIIDKIE